MYIIKSHYQFVDDDIIIIIMIMIMIMIIIVIEVVVQVVIDKVDGVSFRKSNAVIVPSYINAFSPAAMEQTDPFCVEDAILVPQNVVHSIRNIISGKMKNIKLLFRFREEVVVRGSQIRRIRWMFDKLESTFLDSSHGHCGPVSRCIVLVEEHSSCKVSIPNLLDFLP